MATNMPQVEDLEVAKNDDCMKGFAREHKIEDIPWFFGVPNLNSNSSVLNVAWPEDISGEEGWSEEAKRVEAKRPLS